MILFCNDHVAISLALFEIFLVESKSCRKLLALLEAHETINYKKKTLRGLALLLFISVV